MIKNLKEVKDLLRSFNSKEEALIYLKNETDLPETDLIKAYDYIIEYDSDKKIWNHNLAYNKFIKNNIKDSKSILDVGCGKGYLDFYLYNDSINITGIDLNIDIDYDKDKYKNINFIESDFMKYDFNNKFDIIIFVSSIHHLNMKKALKKAKKLLNKDGKIIIIGLYKNSNFKEKLIDLFRIIPVKIISKIKKEKTSEDLNISTNYDIDTLNNIKNVFNTELPKYKLNYGLYYRYKLIWKNNN